MAGESRVFRVRNARDVPADLRRGRNRAARFYKPGTTCRHAILGGYWDAGSIVRDFMGE